MPGKAIIFSALLILTTANALAYQSEGSKFTGMADYHNHMMAEYAFGGAWLHGKHDGEEAVALKSCQGNLIGTKPHGKTVLGPVNELIAKIPGTEGDTGLHLFRTKGYPHYEGWPRWDTIAHQQMWVGHLKQAWQSGLKLMVLSGTSFRYLCQLMPKKARQYSCNEMDSAKLQIKAANKLADKYDWIEIAHSSKEARDIIDRGHLAVVLAVELSEIFESGNWQEELDEFYAMGVRSIQLTHEIDSKYAGAAPHNFIFKLFQFIKNAEHGRWHGFNLDSQGKNKLGLTNEGKALVKAMLDKKMIIDIAHLSERGIKDVLAITKATYTTPYPIFLSHGHIRSMINEEKAREEKTTPDWVLNEIRLSGGVFGLRTGPDATKTFIPKLNSVVQPIPNDCAGSTKSFAQSYLYTEEFGVNVGYATDMNGFIQQIRPRFGNKRETCGAVKGVQRWHQQAQQKLPLGSEFDQKGFAHIGLLPDIKKELVNFGVDTTTLDYSAYHFYTMWQKIEAIS